MAEKRHHPSDDESNKKAKTLTQQVVAQLIYHRPSTKLDMREWLNKLTESGVMQKIAIGCDSDVMSVKNAFIWSSMHRNRHVDHRDMSSETYWNHWRELYGWELVKDKDDKDEYTMESMESFTVEGVPKIWNTCHSSVESGESTVVKFTLPGTENAITRAMLNDHLTVVVGDCQATIVIDGRLAEIRRKKMQVFPGVFAHLFVVIFNRSMEVSITEDTV